jgi:sterol desaturase/sphingolipid hydroxylase (fatty acid hydroxylase superfamily)
MMDQIIATLGGDNGIWWLAGGYFSMVIGERLYHLFSGSPSYNDGDALCSIGLNLMNSVIGMIVSVFLPLVAYIWVYENARWFTISHMGLALVISFVVHELSYYLEHRMAHRVGLLWAFHAIHHSSNEFNHTTAARGFYFDGIARTPFELVGALFGVPPVIYFAMGAMKNLYGIWNHASYVGDLGVLERIFATPRNHKVHHANQPQYIDKNYSQVLLIWDRLLGTFAAYKEEPVVGLVSAVHDNNPLTAQFAGLKQLWTKIKRADRLADKLAYLWRPPEWSHDGACQSDCPKYAPQTAESSV